MRLGTCLPTDESAHVNGQYSIEKAVEALAAAGIHGCLTNFPTDETQWEAYSRRLRNALDGARVELLEYNMPFFISSASRENSRSEAEKTVQLLELAEQTGCLNMVTCVANQNSILPDRGGRSQEYYDTLKATCDMIAEMAAVRGVRARLLIELVYTTVVWSPTELKRLVDDVGSPNVQGHMDIANCLTFDNVYDHGDFMRESFEVLGDRIHSAHIKDVVPINSYFAGIGEVLVGDGEMDIATYLGCLSKMPAGFPAVIEHMSKLEDIKRSYDRTVEIARSIGVEVWDR